MLGLRVAAAGVDTGSGVADMTADAGDGDTLRSHQCRGWGWLPWSSTLVVVAASWSSMLGL